MIEKRKEDAVIKAFFWLLLLTAFTSGVVLDFDAFRVNLSHVICLLLFVLLAIYNGVNKKKLFLIYTDTPSLFIYLYFFSNLISTIAFSPNLAQSLKGCALILTYVFIYVTVRWAARHIDNFSIIQKLLKYNFFSAVFGLACMVISFAQGGKNNIGATVDHLGIAGMESIQNPLPSIQSLSVEPNIFAITTAVILFINFSLYLLWKKSTKDLVILSVLGIAIMFAYTRSVYVSIVVSFLALAVLSGKTKLLKTLFQYSLIAIFFVGALLIVLPSDNDVKHALVGRATSLFEFDKGSGAGRLQGYYIAFEGLKERPILGNGTLSAYTTIYNPYRNEWQERMGSPGWLNGVLIQSMQDTGIVGIIIILLIFGSVILANYDIYRRLDGSHVQKCIALGFLAGNIVLFIASQTSSTFWISFPFIYWGVNIAFVESCKQRLREKEKAAIIVDQLN